MTDDRSPELRAADEALTDAIDAVCRAHTMIAGDELVIHHVTVAFIDGLGLVEEGASRYAVLTRDGGQGPDAAPTHALEGLLRYGLRWLTRDDG